MTVPFINKNPSSSATSFKGELLDFSNPTTEDPSIMPEADPLFYELVVKNSAGGIIRQHQVSSPHKHGERFTTILILQELQKKIMLELPEDL